MPAMSIAPDQPVEFRDPRHQLGLRGEQAARAHLEEMGWAVVAHRFRAGRNDIDLIARLGPVVAFIEVKTRQGTGFGLGREAIHWKKRQAIARAAEVWRQRHGQPDDQYRFDFIEVVPEVGRGPAIMHVADAWRL
jgi:putative endonuclease